MPAEPSTRSRRTVPTRRLPARHTDVAVDVAGFVARVAVAQVFRNPFPDRSRRSTRFRSPIVGAVDAMTMKTGDRVIQADIERREERVGARGGARRRHAASLSTRERCVGEAREPPRRAIEKRSAL